MVALFKPKDFKRIVFIVPSKINEYISPPTANISRQSSQTLTLFNLSWVKANQIPSTPQRMDFCEGIFQVLLVPL